MNRLNKPYFKSYLDNANVVVPGIDYLRLNLKENIDFLDDILFSTDFDNSNFYVKDQYTFIKLNLSTGISLICSVSYNDHSIPIFIYNVFTSDISRISKSYGKFDFYGSFFRLIELEFITIKQIEDLIGFSFENCKITRLDYKFDLLFDESKFLHFPKFNKLIKSRSNSKSSSYSDTINLNNFDKRLNKKKMFYVGNEVNSFSIGTVDSKRFKFRVYNKLLQASNVGKFFLYESYFNYYAGYRFERQLMNKFCIGFRFKDLNDLEQKFYNRLFDKIPNKIFEDQNLKKIIDMNKTEKLRYFKDFIGRGYKLIENGFNPFIILYNGLVEKYSNKSIDRSLLYSALKEFEQFLFTNHKKGL